MTGSNEADGRAQDPEQTPQTSDTPLTPENRETSEVPGSAAPPSFGKAEPPEPEPGPEPGPEPRPEPGPVPGPVPDPMLVPEPLPVEIRLPIGLQKPWWADDDSTDTPEPEPEQPSEPAAETAAEAEPEPEPKEPEPEPEPQDQPDEELPGALVAGEGAPKVDTRHAVPTKPVTGPAEPSPTDTQPDGIPIFVQLENVQPTTEPPTPTQPEPATAEQETSGEPRASYVFLPPGMPPPASSAAVTAPNPLVPPPEPPEPPEAPEQTRPNLTPPVHHAEGGLTFTSPPPGQRQPGGYGDFSGGPFGAPPSGAGQRAGGRRKPLLLIGGGLVAAVLVGIAGFAVATSGSDSTGRTASATATPGGQADATPSQQAPSPGTPAAPRPSGPSKIDHVRTDGRPLALTEAFPTPRITLAGRVYSRDRSSVNHRCELVAAGAMAEALVRNRCTSVVRVTFLDTRRSLAVTSGVAVLPTKTAALRADKAGDPSGYEWFRAMPGKRTPNIDRAGGYAASTVRGRYIAYAYATYANGQGPEADDPTLKAVAEQFVEYALRAIDARARS